jgi:hypothetical protein
MATKKSLGWAALTSYVDEHGQDELLDVFCSRIAVGENPNEIAVSLGWIPTVMRLWLEDDPGRMAAWDLARRCFADGLVYEGLREVRDADVETVQLAKLRSDKYDRTAGRLSRNEWGEKTQLQITETVEVGIRGLLEAREARLMEYVQSSLPVVVEQRQESDGELV